MLRMEVRPYEYRWPDQCVCGPVDSVCGSSYRADRVYANRKIGSISAGLVYLTTETRERQCNITTVEWRERILPVCKLLSSIKTI